MNIDEIEPVYRPWTQSEEIIDVGRAGRVQMMGFHQGSFADLFPKLTERQQLAVVGPGRLGLLRSDAVSFQDLVDPATGRLRLLEKVDGKVVGLKGLGAETGVGGLEGMAGEATQEAKLAWKEIASLSDIAQAEKQLSEIIPELKNIWLDENIPKKSVQTTLDYINDSGRQLAYLKNEFPGFAKAIEEDKNFLRYLKIGDISSVRSYVDDDYVLGFFNREYDQIFIRSTGSMLHKVVDGESERFTPGGFKSLSKGYGGTFRHEVGHAYYDSGRKIAEQETGQNWIQIWKSHDQQWWWRNVSHYGSTNLEEAFSESFSAYTSPGYAMSKKKLPSEVEQYFDKLLRRK